MGELYEIASDCSELSPRHQADDQATTKLWMTSCQHIICNKHLPTDFVHVRHQQEQPAILCPFCPSKHDTTLLWIQGIEQDQHDPAISGAIFEETEYIDPISADDQSTTLKIHHRSALAAAKLFAAQSEVAAKMLWESQQRIKHLEQEIKLLKTKLNALSRSHIPASQKSSTHHLSLVGWKGTLPQQHEAARLTIKRPFHLSPPMIKKTRSRLPERGVLKAYGTPQAAASSPILPEPVAEIDLQSSPAFSTPYLRTKSLSQSTLSPQHGRFDAPDVRPERRFDRTPDHGGSMALELRKPRAMWTRY